MSRRSALSAVSALAVPTLSGHVPSIELGRPYVSAGRSLAGLTGMVGACVITSTAKGAYGDRPQVLRALKEIGATWIRSRIHTGNTGQVTWINQIGASGIKVNALIDTPDGRDTPEQLVALVASSLRSAILSIEGPNEWNLQGGSNWVPELVAHQTRLWNAAKSNAVTRAIPIVGPSLAFNEGFAELGNRSAIMDWGNIHLYPNGFVPSTKMDKALPGERIVCGSKPIIVTETGWHNASNSHTTQYYTPEDVAGLYAPRLLLEYFIRDVPRVAFYELIDEPGARNPAEANFGLIRADFSRKPVFVSLANMRTILTRSYRTSGTAGRRVRFSFRSTASDLRSALVDRGDGRLLLFLWRSEASVYDPKTRKRLTPTPASVSVDWAGVRHRVSRFEPARSANALETQLTAVSKLTLGAELQILEIAPA